jgi:hypothetical protein
LLVHIIIQAFLVDKKPDTSKKQNASKKQQAPQQTVQQAQLADKDILANTNELNMSPEPSGANVGFFTNCFINK